MWQQLTKELQKMQKLLLPTIKVDSQNNKSKNLLKMLKNTNNKIKKLEEKYKLKMAFRAIAWM